MTRILAHRGYRPNHEPDNSFSAFRNAFDYQSDGIEFDIQLSSDGKFICYHDDTLEKIGIKEKINDLLLEDLTSFTLSDGSTIPSLEEILELYANKFLLNIELKSPSHGIQELVSKINQYELIKAPNKLIVSSFHPKQLIKIKKIDPEVPTGLLVVLSRNQVTQAMECKCDALHPFYNDISKGFTKIPNVLLTPIMKYYAHRSFEEATDKGIIINPYTVNNKRYMYECFHRNVFSIITDKVELAKKIRSEFYHLTPSSI